MSTEERDKFALAFLTYVEDTYRKDGDQYYFKNPGISHVHRNANEVLHNFIHMMTTENKPESTKEGEESYAKGRFRELINYIENVTKGTVHQYSPHTQDLLRYLHKDELQSLRDQLKE